MLERERDIETSLWFQKPEGQKKPLWGKEDELVWDIPKEVGSSRVPGI